MANIGFLIRLQIMYFIFIIQKKTDPSESTESDDNRPGFYYTPAMTMAGALSVTTVHPYVLYIRTYAPTTSAFKVEYF